MIRFLLPFVVAILCFYYADVGEFDPFLKNLLYVLGWIISGWLAFIWLLAGGAGCVLVYRHFKKK